MKAIGFLMIVGAMASAAGAQLCNVRIVTDASPDYHDLSGMVRSITSRWETPEQKCWAMFYWNHIARRQTNPMHLHGMALTDPIRQFNDYGHTMCSTISGINQSIWEHMGFYDGRWHMYDNSLSAIYTLCDGKTVAGVEDIGRIMACAASAGRSEPGHIARYHCLTSTSPNGFLIGADTIRSLDEEYRCFNPNGLKLRTYFYDWDYGHRYILNLRDGESYTRFYRSLGDAPDYYVPNNGKDPEAPNRRYHIRGNGRWTWKPTSHPADGIYKINSANVATSLRIKASLSIERSASLLISTNNGLIWKKFWASTGPGDFSGEFSLTDEVNGAYEILVKADLDRATVRSIAFETTTQLNSKTQPRLNLGRNIIHVGAGEQSDSIVLWPELHNNRYKELIVEERNIASATKHPGYQGAIHPAKAKEDAYVVYRIDTPRDMTRFTYGGRFFNRASRSRIEMQHSLDDGQTWTTSWTLTDTSQPWDVIHYETIQAPAGRKSVLIKYVMNTTDPSSGGCSIYAVRMEANHRPVAPTSAPMEVTFTWKEPQKDRSLIERSHTQLIESLPCKYTINVGGEDHPVMESLAVNLKGARGQLKHGYSDGKDVGGRKFGSTWATYGRNLAAGKPYKLSIPSGTSWEAGDPDGRKLTDGVAGPPYSGGVSYRYGAIWNPNQNPVITLDLGQGVTAASFGMNFHGYSWWDALKGEIKDKVEVLISDDDQAYRSIGFLKTDIRWKNLPANHMWTDEETLAGGTFRLIPREPVKARYVQYRITSPRHFCCTELEVLDSIRFEPFDLRIALPE